ncbi:MAG: methylenetetrahydrofolate--tRNA-(uracil(54)-C(5))-methyltransferase (FADH(2)-oxidizing) TrmFO [Longimicrobiales bacterium]
MDAIVIGGGLAGCEAAWQLAERGHTVRLVEMRPVQQTPAHQTDQLAELVCTNSFKSEELSNAHGLLKAEMRALGSILLAAADESRVPAGAALAVDRHVFSAHMSERIAQHPNITIERREISAIPDGSAIIATGPLTSNALTTSIQRLLDTNDLAFYDSIAPIVSGDSVDRDIAFLQSRWGKGEGDDYFNCPLNQEEYRAFLAVLREADTYPGHDWENIPYFEGCLPIEVMASRGDDTLRFGPMKPIGLREPRTGKRPYAVLQLRREDRNGQMWNLVGFQTRLRTGEQKRVFSMIPGLARAEFLRFGSIHRNTYLNFPACLTHYGAPRTRADVIFAGQLTGVEGYTESAASGILAGINLDRVLRGVDPVIPPSTTMLGGLFRYLREAPAERFQPMNSNFGLLDPLSDEVRDKHNRRERLVIRARQDFTSWLREHELAPIAGSIA